MRQWPLSTNELLLGLLHKILLRSDNGNDIRQSARSSIDDVLNLLEPAEFENVIAAMPMLLDNNNTPSVSRQLFPTSTSGTSKAKKVKPSPHPSQQPTKSLRLRNSEFQSNAQPSRGSSPSEGETRQSANLRDGRPCTSARFSTRFTSLSRSFRRSQWATWLQKPEKLSENIKQRRKEMARWLFPSLGLSG